MIYHGNNSTSLSPNLDGKTGCPRQTQEGRLWYQDLLDHYAPLSLSEVEELLELRCKLWDAPPGKRDLSWPEHHRLHELINKCMVHNEATFEQKPRRKRGHAGHELGAREFTLTYSPKWMSDEDARKEMTKALDKLLKYYADEIVELRAVGEVGSNGLSHVHCFYKLEGGRKITDKNFKRAWPYWNPKKPQGRGFEGGHHATVKEEADFKGYIDKDIASAWLEKNVAR